MRKILIIFLFIVLVLTTACTKVVEAQTVKTIIVTETSIVKIEDTTKISQLEEDNKQLKAETEKYQSLTGNLNDLLKNVYYVYQKKSDGSSSWGTGFSIEYKGKYYLITAGHIVDSEYGVFKNLGFKTNLSDTWVYPKLIAYNNDYMARNDYAIFYSDKINNGFIIDNENDNPKYILGNTNLNVNIIRNYNKTGLTGESGSPIIDFEGEIIGIDATDLSTYSTDIKLVLNKIDELD